MLPLLLPSKRPAGWVYLGEHLALFKNNNLSKRLLPDVQDHIYNLAVFCIWGKDHSPMVEHKHGLCKGFNL